MNWQRKADVIGRKYLTANEVHRLIDFAGKVGRQAERDKLLLTLIYRHRLRVPEEMVPIFGWDTCGM